MAKKPTTKKTRTRKVPSSDKVVRFVSPLKTCPVEFGRPTYRTEENRKIILKLIAEGYSLLAISKIEGFPHYDTIRRWMSDEPDFYADYTRAWESSADRMIDQALDIAFDDSKDWVEMIDKEGNVIGKKVNPQAVPRSKLKIDTLIWVAGRKKPNKYGSMDPPPEAVRTPIVEIDPTLPDDEGGRLYHDSIRGD